jgi:hypothetical protein
MGNRHIGGDDCNLFNNCVLWRKYNAQSAFFNKCQCNKYIHANIEYRLDVKIFRTLNWK